MADKFIDQHGQVRERSTGRFAGTGITSTGFDLTPTDAADQATADLLGGDDLSLTPLGRAKDGAAGLSAPVQVAVQERIAPYGSPDTFSLTDIEDPDAIEEPDLRFRDAARGVAVFATAGAIALSTAGCSSDDTPGPPSDSGPVVTAPVETPQPEHTAPEVEAPEVVTEVGATIPADQIAAARAAGAQVYVSPRGDGAGLIVRPGDPLPDEVRADIESILSTPDQMSSVEDFNNALAGYREKSAALRDAGLSAFVVAPFIQIGGPQGTQP